VYLIVLACAKVAIKISVVTWYSGKCCYLFVGKVNYKEMMLGINFYENATTFTILNNKLMQKQQLHNC
jgi:hypothetical protein